MIIDAIINIFISAAKFIIGFLPASSAYPVASGLASIFSYSAYVLGESYSITLISLIIAEVTSLTLFGFLLFILNLIRGSGA